MIGAESQVLYSEQQEILFRELYRLIDSTSGLDFTIDKLEQSSLFYAGMIQPPITDSERLDVVRDLIYSTERIVIADPGAAIKEPFQSWIDECRAETDLDQWKAYRTLLRERGWGLELLKNLDIESDNIIDLMGDPNSSAGWRRKGLMIGEVQSGKTANYIAVANKAIDYGYKLIIIFGGHTEELRRQTQARIDTDLVGRNSEFLSYAVDKRSVGEQYVVGVRKIDKGLGAISFTGVQDDFNASRATDDRWSPGATPTIAVVKKNLKIIENLNAFLKTMGGSDGAFDFPILIIDDEADWGTINTKSEEDPTAISHALAQLLERSTKSCYLAITATPFANILIDAEREQELFPKDFIVALKSPSNYRGVEAFVGSREDHILNDVGDCLDVLPYTHKISHPFHEAPESLKDAICTFIVSTAIRRVRLKNTAPSSMLINISRFNAVQERISDAVRRYVDELADAALVELNQDRNQYRSEELMRLRKVLDVVLKQGEGQWPIIRKEVASILEDMRVELMNVRTIKKRSKTLSQMPKGTREAYLSLPTIFVGGNILSRGLTLEGLITSYFVRKTAAADTLLQTGRWFGYRPGYEDLVRVWMSEESEGRFDYVAELSHEIREQVHRMGAIGMTPSQFGLRMQRHPESFLVTAANKSKASEVRLSVSLPGNTRESHTLSSNIEDVERNRNAARTLWENIRDGYERDDNGNDDLIFRGVDRAVIEDFFDEFSGHKGEPFFGASAESNCQFSEAIPGLVRGECWDVAFISGRSKTDFNLDAKTEIQCSVRNRFVFQPSFAAVQYSRKRVASGTDLRNVAPVEKILQFGGREKITETAICQVLDRPILMVYLTAQEDVDVQKDETQNPDFRHLNPLVAVKVALPGFSDISEELDYYRNNPKKFVVNSVWLKNEFEVEEFEELEDED